MNREEAWKLIQQFFYAAGFYFLGWFVSNHILTAILSVTGAGYFVAITMDSVVSALLAYAIGTSAKVYFKEQKLAY